MSDQRYWLGFSLIPYIGPRRILRLRQWFGDLAAAWSASGDSLREAGLDERALKQLLSRRDDINLDAQIEKVRVAGAWLLTLDDERYPALLRQIDDPPPVLYVRGTLAEADELALSIVGTRKATRYGQQVTHDIARKLARSGVTVVSGLAQGVDGAAHQGALQGGGRTIAVLGSGIDVIYPREHAELARRIVASGALISEFPLGTQPTAANFPRRNRVVSGMALGVLVTFGITLYRLRRPGRAAVFDVCLAGLAGALLVGRAGHVLLHWRYFQDHTAEITRLRAGGLDWHGAVLGALLALLIAARLRRVDVSALLGALARNVVAAQAIGWGERMLDRAIA
ncbi:MAG: DNA-processing protein DprA, partial [Phototrophicaceae bacterium]